MPAFRKPTTNQIRRFQQRQSKSHLTYTDGGATTLTPPAGFVVDRTRIQLGRGRAYFHAAKEALQNWRQFDLPWMEAAKPLPRIAVGENLVLSAYRLGLWWLNAVRIVDIIDETTDACCRFGIVCGTLTDHVECGEERFLLEWNREDDNVWYDVLAFSRPQHPLAYVGYPYVRRVQKSFARESAAALERHLSGQRTQTG